MKNTDTLLGQKAVLESKIDQLEAEISYLNDLLVRCGFTDGIESLKLAAEEVLEETRHAL